MAGHFGLVALGFLLLFVGAEILVRGSASLALRAGLGPLVVGLTIVAFGTSAPELAVSIGAALSAQGDLSVGNAIGSNSFNIGVILGLTALVCPLPVHRQVIRVDAPIALGVALALAFFLRDDLIGRLEGTLLCAGLVAYVAGTVVLARRETSGSTNRDLDAASTRTSRHWGLDIALIVGGMGLLVFGSRLLVEHSVALAETIGISEAVIGLTIVAAGTSMPELATSLVAALRKQTDIAVGNIIGSNIFNVLGILGVASIVSPLRAAGISTVDLATMLLLTVLLVPLLYTGRFLHRLEGVALLSLYAVYVVLLWPA